MTDMKDRMALTDEALESVNGGSWRHTESEIRGAGIDLLNEDGTPGEFGYLWNTGDYYFKGEKISHDTVDLLVCYSKEVGHAAQSFYEVDRFYDQSRYSE